MLKSLPISDNKSVCFVVQKSSNFNDNSVSKMAILCEACHVRKNEKLFKGGLCEDHFTLWRFLSLWTFFFSKTKHCQGKHRGYLSDSSAA